MKDWRKVKAKINIHKNKMRDCVSAMDTTTNHYIQKMCKKGCKFYDGECKKNRYIKECARKGLKNKE